MREHRYQFITSLFVLSVGEVYLGNRSFLETFLPHLPTYMEIYWRIV